VSRCNRIVLAYSGSLNTSVAVAWLAEHYGAQVVTVTLDLGQGDGLEAVRDRALASGARRAHVVDARDEFARDFIVPALRAGAVTEDGDPLVTALSRPLIARHLLEVARVESADAVAHGCSGGADRVRLESLLAALDPSMIVLAPVREWGLAPAEVAACARARGIAVADDTAAVDANLWGRTIDGSRADGRPARARREWVLTRAAGDTPDTPAHVDVAFEEGVPVAVNGVKLSLVELISSLETIAGAHGVGRLQGPGDSSGRLSDLAIEAPAAIVLHEAHRALQQCVTPPDVVRSAADLGARYADLVAGGGWYTEARESGDALTAGVEKRVTGTARVKLFKGRSEVVECQSPFARATPDARSPIAVLPRR
jgi:argininosuccinate synthase